VGHFFRLSLLYSPCLFHGCLLSSLRVSLFFDANSLTSHSRLTHVSLTSHSRLTRPRLMQLEEFFETKCRLELSVKVAKGWRADEERVKEFGY